nr:MAG TPA: protein of unknown function (DUF5383) [Caudoviricetes sp.]
MKSIKNIIYLFLLIIMIVTAFGIIIPLVVIFFGLGYLGYLCKKKFNT